MVFGIERHAVIAFAVSDRVTPHNVVGRRVDHGEHILLLKIYVDLARDWVVLRHPSLPSKVNGIDDLVFSYIHDRYCTPALVRNVQSMERLCVRTAIRLRLGRKFLYYPHLVEIDYPDLVLQPI